MSAVRDNAQSPKTNPEEPDTFETAEVEGEFLDILLSLSQSAMVHNKRHFLGPYCLLKLF